DLEMSLALQRRNVDTGDTGYRHVIKLQVADQSDLARPIAVGLNGAQITAASIERHDELDASPRVGKPYRNIAELHGILQSLARFLAHARFHRMLTFAEKFDQLAHPDPP